MAQMYVIITLRKPIDDAAEGETVYNIIKQKLADRPDIEISGQCSNHYEDT